MAFFKEPEPCALALQAVVAALELEHSTHACKSVCHDGNDGAIAQAFDIGLNPDAPAVFLRRSSIPDIAPLLSG